MTITIPAGTNNQNITGPVTSTCSLSGGVLDCDNNVSNNTSTDDVILETIRFDNTVFDAASSQIIPGLASVFLEGGGGTNVNAEWGDNDNNSDDDDNPFVKAGFPNAPQESQDIDVINATLLQVFRTLNLMEGVDGEDQNFRLQLIFENGVADNDGAAIDSTPEIIVFERGLNSDVAVQLLLQDGGETDELFIPRAAFRDSGLNADTVEIGGGQPMGVAGVDLNEFFVDGVPFNPTGRTVVGVRFGSAGGGADIFGVFGTSVSPIALRDRGDAPDSYGTEDAVTGPSHVLDRDLFIGLPPNPELTGQPNADATGDDAVGTNDESLLYQFPTGPFSPGDTFTVTVPVFNQTGANALLCGWVDFNRNGSFQNTDATSGTNMNAERICATVVDGSVSTGTNPDTVALDFIVPADFDSASSSGVFARFRLTSDWTQASDASPLGPARTDSNDADADGIGEVEDVLIGADFGDLPAVYPKAMHTTVPVSSNPYLGSPPDNELGPFFTVDADGDDLNGTPDENGVVLDPSSNTDGNGNVTFTASIIATNPSAEPSLVCGWFDFNKDGVLGNTANTSTTAADPDFATRTDSGERSCAEVAAGATGSFPGFPMTWTIPVSAQGNSGQFYFRFRISNDPDMFDSALLSPAGGYTSGEVEDYRSEDVGSLPVSISSFSSRYTDKGLELTWVTVSETHNLGFYVWGDKGNGLEPLSSELIPAEDGDPATPRAYSIVLPGLVEGDVLDLAVTAVDYRGDEEVYGLFEAGAGYGKEVAPAAIDWQEIRHQASVRDQMHAAETRRANSARTFGTPATQRPDYVDIRVTEPGLQEVTWQMLADAGMDLDDVAAADIALTLKGQPVSRHILGTTQNTRPFAQLYAAAFAGYGKKFGPGGKIRFWGEAPATEDSIYVDHYVYRISVAPRAGRAAGKLNRRANDVATQHLNWLRQDIDTGYHFGSALEDPWYAARLRADRNNSYTTHFTVDNALRSDQPGRLKVLIAGLTDFPEAPDHRALFELNGEVLGESIFDGQAVRMLDLEVPAGLLTAGQNTVRVIAPGGTAAPFDLFLVDTVELGYPRDLSAIDGRLLVEAPAPNAGLAISGISPADAAAYGWDGENLHILKPNRHSGRAFAIATLDDPSASYWVSASDRIQRPRIVGAATRPEIFGGDKPDLLVIAHPAFMPLSRNESHPLNDYIAQREDEGWTVGLFDVTDIQAVYGYGMALPRAVTAFLKAADRRFEYEHVLLVGGDSYDYTDNLGLGSVSFIPTRYAATSFVPHTPSDALLADLDGDGLSDKAVGRWPVRTAGDLEAIVSKTLDWPNISHPQSSVWMTDSEDSRTGSFNDQADRVLATLDDAGWPADTLDRVYFNQTAPRPGLSVADSAREDLFDLLEQGRALTGFVGHGAPSMWSFQGMVTPDDLSGLFNEGNPTMIGTMTCYTSYFVSPAGDSVAHRWMNGYRENAAGDRIPGVPNGAAAVHGAATLSDYAGNEAFMQAVLDAQLKGATIGQAVETARQAAHANGGNDRVINWTLLGDPTLKLSETQ